MIEESGMLIKISLFPKVASVESSSVAELIWLDERPFKLHNSFSWLIIRNGLKYLNKLPIYII